MNLKKLNKKLTIVWIILIIMLIQNLIYFFIVLSDRGFIEVKVNEITSSSVQAEVEKKITSLNISGEIKSTVNDTIGKLNINNLIYNTVVNEVSKIPVINGKDGANGKDGVDGINGLTPILICNTDKNRWEVTYDNRITYKIVLDQNNKSVKCIGV